MVEYLISHIRKASLNQVEFYQCIPNRHIFIAVKLTVTDSYNSKKKSGIRIKTMSDITIVLNYIPFTSYVWVIIGFASKIIDWIRMSFLWINV